jgi:DNA-binding SARP family transcriptional activator
VSAHVVRIRLLGGFSVDVDGVALPDGGWQRRSAAALVKLLALSSGLRLHREQVITALWPDLVVAEAAPRLHKAAHYARRWLGGSETVVLSGETVALLPCYRVEVDAVEFEHGARSALEARDQNAAAARADAYPGDLLPDDLYEPWTEEPRDRLRLLHLDLLRLAQRWERLAAHDPADEQAHVALARRFAEAGDRAAALRQFERLERALRQELGIGLSTEAALLQASLLSEHQTDERPSSDTDLLGRAAELAWVESFLARVRRGEGRVLFLSGPAGVGTTSVLTAVERHAIAARMRVGTGLAARIDGAWPFAPVLEALADLSRRHPALLDALDDVMRAEIERALSGRHGDWQGQNSHQRLFVAAAELLRLAAADGGAVLVVDDAHHADEASLRLLHFLARTTVGEPVAIVLGHRPIQAGVLAEVRSTLLGRGTAATLDLRPLSPSDALALARRHASSAPVPTLRAVVEANGRLPFGIVEGARAVAADPSGPSGLALLPATLAPDALRAMATVAVLGASFDTDEFVELTGLGDDDAYAVLDEALAGRLIHRTSEGFSFGHALQREALLERWTGPGGRRAAHLAGARALERLGGSPARIARHLVQAGQTAAAVPWALRAADTQAALGAYRDALATVDDIRAAATGEDSVRLLALRADLLNACGDLGAIEAYREAMAAARDGDDRARIRTRLARAAAQHGDLETAGLAIDDLPLDGGSNDGELLVARAGLAIVRGDMAAAAEAAAEARRLLSVGGAVDNRLFVLVTLQGLLAHHRGEWFPWLRAELRTGIQRPDLAVQLFDSHLCVAEYLLYGPTPYDEVLELAADLRRTAERAGALRAVAFAVALRGEAALLKGDLRLAETELTEAADLHRTLEFPGGEAVCLQRHAEVHLHRGDRDAAAPLLRRALHLARWSTFARCLLPRIYGTMISAAPDPLSASDLVERAEATLGPDDDCLFCSIMLTVPAARACAEAGDLDRARRFLARAETVETRWEGTAWEASLAEVRAVLARTDGDDAGADRLLASAASLFDAAGQPLDAARCRGALGAAPLPSSAMVGTTSGVTPGR